MSKKIKIKSFQPHLGCSASTLQTLRVPPIHQVGRHGGVGRVEISSCLIRTVMTRARKLRHAPSSPGVAFYCLPLPSVAQSTLPLPLLLIKVCVISVTVLEIFELWKGSIENNQRSASNLFAKLLKMSYSFWQKALNKFLKFHPKILKISFFRKILAGLLNILTSTFDFTTY